MNNIRNFKYNEFTKSFGPQAGRLILSLYERQRSIFQLREAQEILGGDRNTVQQLVFSLVEKGIATRLKPGLFRLVPFELGFEREYLGNPYIVARELARPRRNQNTSKNAKDYYLSHGSAFDLHQMVTQPQLVVYVTAPRLIRSRTILGTEFRFVRCKPSDLFGITEIWVDKSEKVQVSDLERSILDGFKQPSYCGGIAEVAKGLWIKKETVDPKKLVDYALQLDVGAIIRRLGFLMELYEVNAGEDINRLRSKLTNTYQLLGPDLPAEGKFNARWKLRLNITEEELRHLVRT
jgi:predicted transcriptional regulator of viral defense system